MISTTSIPTDQIPYDICYQTSQEIWEKGTTSRMSTHDNNTLLNHTLLGSVKMLIQDSFDYLSIERV